MTVSNGKVRRKRRTGEEWRALLSGFGTSGLSVEGFCERAAITTGSFHRWQKLLGRGIEQETRCGTPGFVDLGTLASPGATATQAAGRLELTRELGGEVVLHLVRG